MAVAALALEDITVTFVSQDGGRYTALRNTTLRIAPGEFVSVVGPTGCGKSTLLNVAVGLLQPSAGRIRVFDEPLAGLNRKAGYLFQTEALMPWRNASRLLRATARLGLGLLFVGRDIWGTDPTPADFTWRVGNATPSAAGFVVDGFGGLHPVTVGNAPVATPHDGPYWPGWNIARGVALMPGGIDHGLTRGRRQRYNHRHRGCRFRNVFRYVDLDRRRLNRRRGRLFGLRKLNKG